MSSLSLYPSLLPRVLPANAAVGHNRLVNGSSAIAAEDVLNCRVKYILVFLSSDRRPPCVSEIAGFEDCAGVEDGVLPRSSSCGQQASCPLAAMALVLASYRIQTALHAYLHIYRMIRPTKHYWQIMGN